jgi:hypothetical protein
MAKSKHYYIRRTHRYLGVVLGVQFLIWTISGLYFSWTNLDEIHGDFQHKNPSHLSGSFQLVSPGLSFKKSGYPVDSIHSVQLVSILGKPHYHLQFFSGKSLRKVLADATTGDIRKPISREEAISIAAESFNGVPDAKSIEYITSTSGHHEYREKPLPAWAITFEHPTNTTVYVSEEAGKVESFRNNKWRIFDFLWMGHTMDYKGRDNINNWLLRIFSVFGLLTILSGFVLFGISSKRMRRKKTMIISTSG